MDIDHDVPTILATLRLEADPELTPIFYTMEDLWERKLWHQLTSVIREFYGDPKSEPIRLRFFTQFISIFQSKINQLSLVTFGLAAITNSRDSGEALAFLTKLADKVDTPETGDAHIFAQIEIARVNLQLNDVDNAKTLLDAASNNLEKYESVDLINAAYYSVWSEYYKKKADFTAFYRNALLYLACINLEDIPEARKQQLAYELGIAALLGDQIYNFGELLLHPILESLKNSQYQWLVDLLYALNNGNIKEFEKSLNNFSKAPLLQNSLPFLRQKICLTALCEAVFSKPTSDRTLSFEYIAKETHLISDEVEHLVMKALSLGLIKGSIDEVEQKVTITWLQPRVLSVEHIESMRNRLDQWSSDVDNLGKWMEDEGKDVWVTA